MSNLNGTLEKNSALIDAAIKMIITGDEHIVAPMLYSSIAEGKKIRSFIFLELIEILGSNKELYIDIAAAIEIIHTYSLIHDDLPPMDNSDLRRGKLSNHKKFDEATAILAGDALLTLSFEIISNSACLDSEIKIELIRELSKASGYKGMIEGQLLDIRAQNKEINITQLKQMYYLKTGKLFTFCSTAPCFISGSLGYISSLEKFAYNLGMLYQITDDVIDYTSDPKISGKEKAKDSVLNKMNFVSLLGLDDAVKEIKRYEQNCIDFLRILPINKSCLIDLVKTISSRKN